MKMCRLFVLISLLFMSASIVAEPAIHILSHDRVGEILQRYRNKSLVMSLWSVDCKPCHEELKLFAELKKDHNFDLVLISVDGKEAVSDVNTVLSTFSFASTEFWIFDVYQSVKLRYAIDREWQGELPRTYLYDGQNRHQSISGKLNRKRLLQWLARFAAIP